MEHPPKLRGANVVEFDNKDREDKMASSPTYQGKGNSLEAALRDAYKNITPAEDVGCRVLQLGYGEGGYAKAPQFYVLVSETKVRELYNKE